MVINLKKHVQERIPPDLRGIICSIWLVGSQASATAKRDSDIDILLGVATGSALDVVEKLSAVLTSPDRAVTIDGYGEKCRHELSAGMPRVDFIVAEPGQEELFSERIPMGE